MTAEHEEEIGKATPNDAGCWIEGWWGQYGAARVVQIAGAYGYPVEADTAMAEQKLATMGPSTSPELTDDQEEYLQEAADDAEGFLNEHVAPEGYSFGWYEGEFFLWSTEQWEEEG